MGLFRNITDSIGLTRRETLNLDVAGAFNPQTFLNEIMGVEAVEEEITLPDGTKEKRLVTRGATPEQQAFITSLTSDIQSLLGDITELSQIGVAIENDTFSPVIQSLRESQREAREDAFRRTSRLREENLARRGLSDSTAAIEAREQLASQLNKQAVEDERTLVLAAEDLRDRAINRAGVGLSAGQTERGSLSQTAENLRSGQINLASGQQQLTLNAQRAMFNDRMDANTSQIGNLMGSALAIGTAGMLPSLPSSSQFGLLSRNLGTSLSQGVSPNALFGAF